ncbi:MAG: hypothetical protein Q7T56_14755 [Nocardioidaceae bacterium]|nr:hypothetical protein [Nocardioidaceae bacterium]
MQFTATGTPASVVYEYVPVDAGAFYNYSVVLGGTAYHRITLTFYAVNGTTVTGTYVGPVSNASKPVRAIENPSTVPAGSAYARLSIELLTAAGSPAAVGATLTATDLLILSESSPVYASVSNYDRASAQRNLIPNPGIAELGASGWTTPFTGDSMSHDGTALTYSYLGGRARSPVQSRSASHRAGS